jgi:hypothetical protein
MTRLVVGGEAIAKPFAWPVFTPSGLPATRSWPMDDSARETKDHGHQKSVWFSHGGVVASPTKKAGIDQPVLRANFWSEEPGHGRIRLTDGEFTVKTSGGLPNEVNANYDWTDHAGRTLLEERRTVTFFQAGPNAWRWEWRIILEAANGDAEFEDTKEGSMGVRVVDSITERQGGQLVDAKGRTGEKNIWGREADWCAYAGRYQGKPIVVALLDDPANPHRACWHVRSYGLLAANPFGRVKSGFPDRVGMPDAVRIRHGESLEFRYGLLVLDGELDEARHLLTEALARWGR